MLPSRPRPRLGLVFLRRTAPKLLALIAACTLASCSTPPHRINLKDGTMIDARDQPSLSTKTGYWRYKDRFGKDALLRADEVLLIERL